MGERCEWVRGVHVWRCACVWVRGACVEVCVWVHICTHARVSVLCVWPLPQPSPSLGDVRLEVTVTSVTRHVISASLVPLLIAHSDITQAMAGCVD